MKKKDTDKNRSNAENVLEKGKLSVIDNDLALDNIENDFDMTAADLQDYVNHKQ